MSEALQYDIYVVVIYIIVFLFGAVVGSFLNVCIYRLPKNESIVKSNSHCMSCNTPILKRDLIPILSWCLLKGKCRECGAKISPRYTVVEALNAIGWVLISLHFDIISCGFYAILNCLVFSALIVVFFMDWDTQLISMYVVAVIALLAIPEYFLYSSRSGLDLKSHIIGLFIISVPMLIIALASKEKALGMGDVYLMAAAGLYLGMARSIVAFFVGIIVAAIAGLIIKHFSGNSKFAFGPWLSIGILVSIVWGWDLANLYMNFTGLGELIYGEGYVSRLPFGY
ncbi:MAG: prepilin peptidase [Ruminococcus sp.]|nr:prepilin peptidase [Ruminococcus sp.]